MIENGILVRVENEHAIPYGICYRLAPRAKITGHTLTDNEAGGT